MPKLYLPLRYPGGKQRAIATITAYFPANLTTLCAPFLGGGAVELYLNAKGVKVYAYDAFRPLVNFWREVIKDSAEIAARVMNYFPLSRERFYYLQANFYKIDDAKESAAVFYVLNRASFSGLTLSGGMSSNHARFNLAGIQKLSQFKINNFYLALADFRTSILNHANDFLFLDPPYYNGQKLYGMKGDHHNNFDHLALFELLSQRRNWLLCYNDCANIRTLYQKFEMIKPYWCYGMGKTKLSNEIMIVN